MEFGHFELTAILCKHKFNLSFDLRYPNPKPSQRVLLSQSITLSSDCLCTDLFKIILNRI